ncbi:MAG: anaerobic ribonucleoside-triphosphate reductase activating protein [Hungatella sp.]|nr:anaerobic ribonucleoside-triphosphate reductase activating protein [Hungatella sp.]
MRKLKYASYSIVMKEVPNEISLAINISGCPYRCKGCHSQYLWEYTGAYLTNNLEMLLNMYDGLITCVCFMGGDQNESELLECLKIVKQRKLKTCLYTGKDFINNFRYDVINNLDFIKTGKYIEELGGLNCSTTNQRMYDLNNNKEIFFYKREK